MGAPNAATSQAARRVAGKSGVVQFRGWLHLCAFALHNQFHRAVTTAFSNSQGGVVRCLDTYPNARLACVCQVGGWRCECSMGTRSEMYLDIALSLEHECHIVVGEKCLAHEMAVKTATTKC